MVPRVTTACGFGTVGIDGTVGIERWGGGRGDGVSLWAAARDFLFLGRSRCCSGGAQNNGSGQRNYRPDRHFPSPSPLGCDRCSAFPPKHRAPATIPSIISHRPWINAGLQITPETGAPLLRCLYQL